MNLRPPFVTVSTHTSAFNAVAFQSYAMSNARMSLWTQSVHSFSFPPRPLLTAPSRFLKPIRFGSRPPLIRRSIPAHKSLLVRNVVSMPPHRVTKTESCDYSLVPLLPGIILLTIIPLLGQPQVSQVTNLCTDGVHCREPAGVGPIVLKLVPVNLTCAACYSGITMNIYLCELS